MGAVFNIYKIKKSEHEEIVKMAGVVSKSFTQLYRDFAFMKLDSIVEWERSFEMSHWLRELDVKVGDSIYTQLSKDMLDHCKRRCEEYTFDFRFDDEYQMLKMRSIWRAINLSLSVDLEEYILFYNESR